MPTIRSRVKVGSRYFATCYVPAKLFPKGVGSKINLKERRISLAFGHGYRPDLALRHAIKAIKTRQQREARQERAARAKRKVKATSRKRRVKA